MLYLYIVSLVLFHSENVEVEMTRAGPLCMSQYLDILSCYRIPGEEVDTHRRSPVDQSRHIIVAHNDHVSKIAVLVYRFNAVGLIQVFSIFLW